MPESDLTGHDEIRRLYLLRCRNFIDSGYYARDNLFTRSFQKLTEEQVWIEIGTLRDSSEGLLKFERIRGECFAPVSVGHVFGPAWSVHWFRLCVTIRDDLLLGKEFDVVWDAGCEALVYSAEGKVLQGLSSERKRLRLSGERVTQFYLQCTCNGMFGVGQGSIIGPPNPAASFSIHRCEAVMFDAEIEEWIRGMQVLLALYETLPDGLPARNAALFHANASVQDNSPDPIYRFFKRFAHPATCAPFEVFAVGNCHIDTAWLWDIKQTRLKTARSWSSQLQLLRDFPEMRFAISQMQQLEWLRGDFPTLFSEVKEAVQRGQFIALGGCWVEMDGNMPSGESLVRQFFYGQRFIREHLWHSADNHIFWLPDTFGYNAQLPQLAKKARCKYFVSQKLSWNNINVFPHSTFSWTGLVQIVNSN